MESSTSKDTATTTTVSHSATGHSAHHIAEFGDVDKIVHLVDRDGSHAGTDVNSAVGSISKVGAKGGNSAKRLRKRLIRKRRLQQYFLGETLFRTMGLRTIAKDELFLDLIIVANIAAIGHELRETFNGWLEVEKFLLLFGAVYSSWRALVIFWNVWGVYGDVFDKAVVYVTFAALTGIGVGAHEAFKGARSYVSISSFLASAVPFAFNLLFSKKEELLKNENNLFNHNTYNIFLQFLTTLPYFAAAFVRNQWTARILFWIPPAAQIVLYYISYQGFQILHRNRSGTSRVAVNIELFTEKYEVLTLIVLGESLLAILFEAAKFISKPEARIGLLYAAVVGATALVYSFQTLYVNVDNKITHGGTHAIRARVLNGLTFSMVHIPYHISLVLFATGLGILLRDIVIDPTKSAPVLSRILDTAVSRATVTETSGPAFKNSVRWLFSASWAVSLVCSAVMSALHTESPRDKTKRYRLAFRVLVAIALGVGMPFSGLNAGLYLVVHTLTSVVITAVEYILVHVDHVGLLARRDVVKEIGGKDVDDDFFSTSDSSDSDTDDTEDEAAQNVTANAGTGIGGGAERPARCALTRRMTCRNRHRLQEVDMSDKKRYEACSALHN